MIALLCLLAATTPEQDAVPLDRYLDADRVVQALRDLGPGLAACGAGLPDGGWPLWFSLAGDGTVVGGAAGPRMDGAPTPLRDCVAQVLAAGPLPVHDELPQAVQATILVRAGLAAPGPIVELAPRPTPSLFLFVPPGLAPSQEDALLGALGLSTGSSDASVPWYTPAPVQAPDP